MEMVAVADFTGASLWRNALANHMPTAVRRLSSDGFPRTIAGLARTISCSAIPTVWPVTILTSRPGCHVSGLELPSWPQLTSIAWTLDQTDHAPRSLARSHVNRIGSRSRDPG